MSVFAPLDPVPQSAAIEEGGSKTIAGIWFRWLSQLVARSTISILRVATLVHRTGSSASISASTLFLPSQDGDFRISYYAQVTTPATTSSALTITIGWKNGGIAQSKTFAPASLTGNTTASNDGDGLMIRADSGQAVTYATGYTSVGGTPMSYALDVFAESLPA